MGNKPDILVGELIGCRLAVISSKNRCNEGLQGTVVDETRNTITIKTQDNNKKRLIKKENVFEFTSGIKKSTIKGEDLVARPEERTKKWLRPKKKRRISELK